MATPSSLPPGFCFNPSDDELIYYLKKKINNDPIETGEIRDANVYDYDPKKLTDEKFPQGIGQDEMFNFFTSRERKYRNGSRPDRKAGNGYWKASSADTKIKVEDEVQGFKKVLVFYYGTPSDPKKIKTNWIMHEYRLNQDQRRKRNAQDMRLDDWVLCRIYERGAVRNQEPAHKPIVVHHQNDSAQVAAETNNITTTAAHCTTPELPATTTYFGDGCEQSSVVYDAHQTDNQEIINFGNHVGTSSSDDHFGTSSTDLFLDQAFSEAAAEFPHFSEEEVEFLRMCCSDTNIEAQQMQPEIGNCNNPVTIEDNSNLKIAEQHDADIEALRVAAPVQTASYQFGNWNEPFYYLGNDSEIGGLWN